MRVVVNCPTQHHAQPSSYTLAQESLPQDPSTAVSPPLFPLHVLDDLLGQRVLQLVDDCSVKPEFPAPMLGASVLLGGLPHQNILCVAVCGGVPFCCIDNIDSLQGNIAGVNVKV